MTGSPLRSQPSHVRQLVLASSSPRRRELVASLDLSLPVLILSSNTDEDTPPDWTPEQIALQLALRKARAVLPLLTGKHASSSVVIGADTIVVLDGEVLGKPKDEADAVSTLSRLQGRTHEVYTGVACIGTHNGAEQAAHRVTRVTMKPLALPRIKRYVESGEPMDKAGSYGIQGLGAVLVDKIEGCYFNVVGLPLSLLSDMLAVYGIDVL